MNFFKIVIYFSVFSFAGWISETIICSVNERKFVKRGFLTGPFIPVYGFGGLIVTILLAPLKENPVVLYVVGVIMVTILEYITAVIMETVFHLKLWDYSGNKFNYKGRIWIVSSLFFGFLTLFGVYVLNQPLTSVVDGFSDFTIKTIGITLCIYFMADTINSVIAINSINAKLKKIEGYVEELLWLTDQGIDLDTAYHQSRMKKVLDNFEKETEDKIKVYLDDKENEISKTYKTNWFQRRFLNAYPHLHSEKRSKALENLKQKSKEARQKIMDIKTANTKDKEI